MHEKDILDAPEEEVIGLKIPLKTILLTFLLFPIAYVVFFILDSAFFLSSRSFDLWKFKFDLSKLLFIGINCFGLYLFISFIKYELHHWFRIMTISISIVLCSMLLLFAYFFLSGDTSDFFGMFKIMAFVSLVVGAGCSLAVQFLHKKHYMIFSVIMIATIVVFSLVENL